MANSKPKSKGAWTALWIVVWIVWTFLFFSWPTDMLVIFLQGEETKIDAPDFSEPLFSTLLFVGFINIFLTFVARWFFFRFLINEKRFHPGHAGATAWGIVGALCIYSLTKSVETYGLVLGLQDNGNLSEHLIFWIPSLIVMIIHLPNFLIKGKFEDVAG